jgi:hypothetical protein
MLQNFRFGCLYVVPSEATDQLVLVESNPQQKSCAFVRIPGWANQTFCQQVGCQIGGSPFQLCLAVDFLHSLSGLSLNLVNLVLGSGGWHSINLQPGRTCLIRICCYQI